MIESHTIFFVLPAILQWGAVVGIALLVPILPLVIVRALNIKDTRKTQIEQRTVLTERLRQDNFDSVVLLTVPDWPSMEDVVYEDASTGPTPVGFEFKADTVTEDIGNALSSQGIEVRTMEITDVETIEDLDGADLVAIIYPARHKQLPWKLLAFFDEIIEPRVAAYEPALSGVPFAALALGDTDKDVAAGRQHIQRMVERYGISVRNNDGLVDTPDRLALYERTLDYAESLLPLGKEETPQRKDKR